LKLTRGKGFVVEGEGGGSNGEEEGGVEGGERGEEGEELGGGEETAEEMEGKEKVQNFSGWEGGGRSKETQKRRSREKSWLV
jgi:hypothetical protein